MTPLIAAQSLCFQDPENDKSGQLNWMAMQAITDELWTPKWLIMTLLQRPRSAEIQQGILVNYINVDPTYGDTFNASFRMTLPT